MTTAHRPTFDPARGKDNSSAPTRQYASRSMPAHKVLKYRQAGQGGATLAVASDSMRDELLAAEAAHFQKTKGNIIDTRPSDAAQKRITAPDTQRDGDDTNATDQDEETPEAKRRRILEETKDIDADDSDSAQEEDSSDESDDEEETAELMRELEKIKAERAAEKARKEAEQAAQDQAKREEEIAFSNPLMNSAGDFTVKRRWDEDVVFRVKEKDESGKKDFINDVIRSDFHKSFMRKYVR